MAIDLSWLIGRHLRSIAKKDFTWFFVLDDASSISTESHWRLIKKRVVLTSDDDGQLFGLSSPVDAAKEVGTIVGKSLVNKFELNELTGDLALCFENDAMIQFVTLSAGYEGWQIWHDNQSIICLGGGELAIFGPKH